MATGTSTWSKRQDSGVRSGRQRTKRVVPRKRPFSMASYFTSATSSSRSGTQGCCRRWPDHRLGVPGITAPSWWAAGSIHSAHGCSRGSSITWGRSSSSSSRRRWAVKLAATPQWCRWPESSCRPTTSEPTPSPSTCILKPATATSTVRVCLTLNWVRLLGS